MCSCDATNQIPKIIHYCWFGKKKMEEFSLKCMNAWKRFFPDYTFMLWNEDNFPIDKFPYAKEAYRQKRMAFVSDVARMYALEQYGGVYFDTDVMVIRDMTPLLQDKAMVLGCEVVGKKIGTGFIACAPHHKVIQRMLQYYLEHPFVGKNPVTNTEILADIVKEMYGIVPTNEIQENDDLIMYPRDYFTAFDCHLEKAAVTKNTYCVHCFRGSWFGFGRKLKSFVKTYLHRLKHKHKNKKNKHK